MDAKLKRENERGDVLEKEKERLDQALRHAEAAEAALIKESEAAEGGKGRHARARALMMQQQGIARIKNELDEVMEDIEVSVDRSQKLKMSSEKYHKEASLSYQICGVGKHFEKLTGYSAEEIMGKKGCGFLQGKKTDEQMVNQMRFHFEKVFSLISYVHGC